MPNSSNSKTSYIISNYKKFSEGFFGYGNWRNKYWAIGIEERGCGNVGLPAIEEAYLRFSEAKDSDLVQLNDYCESIRLAKYAKSSTWNALAELFCPILGCDISNSVGNGFRRVLAPKLTLLELQPLPCPNVKEEAWKAFWGKHIGQNKEAWKNECIPGRIERIANEINSGKPRLIVCYGSSDDTFWKQLAEKVKGREIRKLTTDRAKISSTLKDFKPQTGILVLPHPRAIRQKGTSGRKFYRAVGEKLEKLLNNT